MGVVYIKTNNQEKINYILLAVLGFLFNFLIMSGLNLFNYICKKVGINDIIIFIIYIISLYPLFLFLIKGYNFIFKLANVKLSNVTKKKKMGIPITIGLYVVFNLIESTLQINEISSTYIRFSAISFLAVIFLLFYLKYYEKSE